MKKVGQKPAVFGSDTPISLGLYFFVIFTFLLGTLLLCLLPHLPAFLILPHKLLGIEVLDVLFGDYHLGNGTVRTVYKSNIDY